MFVLVDVETDGLDEDQNVILELGIIIIRDDLTSSLDGQTRRSWQVRYDDLAERRERAFPAVREMHDKSGLWRACVEEGRHPTLVEADAVRFLEKNGATGFPMTGNSIHFDRRFLKKQMPLLEKAFFYRSIDISTLTELARFWAPAVYTNRPHAEEKDKPHRVILDLENSIAQLRYYRKGFLR